MFYLGSKLASCPHHGVRHPAALCCLSLCVRSAKVLNSTFILLNFLAWVCCCVSFGGKLIHVTFVNHLGGGDVERDFY